MRKDIYFKIIIVLALLNFLLRLPFSNLPLYNDETNSMEAAIKIYNNNLNPFVEFWSYKPPLLFETTAVLFKIFSPSRVWGRIVVYFFSSFSLIFCYLLGKKLFNKEVGFLSTILLFFFPLFFVHSFLFLVDTPLVALALAALYFYFTNKYFYYFLAASLSVLAKEPMIFFIIFLSFYDVFSNTNKLSVTRLFRRFLLFLSPVTVFIVWMMLNKKFLGWYLWPGNISIFLGENTFQKSLDGLSWSFKIIFQEQNLAMIFFLLYSAFIFSFWWPHLKKNFLKKEVIFFNLLFLFYFFFFSSSFLPRYLLFVYPLIFISFLWLLEVIFQNSKILPILFVFSFCFLFVFQSLFNFFFAYSRSEVDISLLRHIFLRKKAVSYLEKTFLQPFVISSWEFDLQRPESGYASQAIEELSYCPLTLKEFGYKDSLDWLKDLKIKIKKPILFIASPGTDFGDCSLNERDWVLNKEIRLNLPFPEVKREKIRIFEFRG